MVDAVGDGSEGEVRVGGRVWGVEVGVDDGDEEASGVEDPTQLERRVHVALEWMREEDQTVVVSWVHYGLCFSGRSHVSGAGFSGDICRSFNFVCFIWSSRVGFIKQLLLITREIK